MLHRHEQTPYIYLYRGNCDQSTSCVSITSSCLYAPGKSEWNIFVSSSLNWISTLIQVSPVIQACCVFLESQLDPSNALGIAAFAEQHHCSNLYKVVNKFIDQYFFQVYWIFE